MNVQLKNENVFVYFKLIVATFFWGGTWVAAKILVSEVPPFTAAFVRFVIALLALGVLLYRQEGFVKLSKDNLKTVFWLGLTGIFLYSFFFERFTPHQCRAWGIGDCTQSCLDCLGFMAVV